MRTCSLLAVLLGSPVPALAADKPAENAPEYLLGDLGVRVDLPKGSWRMTRWSDWDFSAESGDGSVLFFVWATPLQVPVGADAKAWGPIYTGKIEEMKGAGPKVTGGRIETVAGRKVAFVDAEFEYGKSGIDGRMYGATFELVGQQMHLATIGPERFAKAAERGRSELVKRLDWQGGPPPSTYGAEVTAHGVTTKLPPDWRPLLDAEWNSVVGTLAKLGLEDVTGCWTAIRTRPAVTPDLMVTCSRPVRLGVVDEHSFESAEEKVREKLFGKSIAAGARVDLSDRLGFVYAPRDGLAMGAVPDEHGAAVTWAIGEGPLGDSVKAAMSGSTFSGPHPVESGEVVSYWLTQRTFSPQVLCPILCCLGGIGAVGVGAVAIFAMRGRKRTDEDED